MVWLREYAVFLLALCLVSETPPIHRNLFVRVLCANRMPPLPRLPSRVCGIRQELPERGHCSQERPEGVLEQVLLGKGPGNGNHPFIRTHLLVLEQSLNLCTIDIWGEISVYSGGPSCDCRVLCNIPTFTH